MKDMFKSDILLTVIITIYNTAPYLGRCIESVMGQTYDNLEILLIDDGSTDGSGEICDTYALKDRRIRVCHKQNQGVVSARKSGVEIAEGEVIAFVDGDDWIEHNMYEHMMSVYMKEKPDMVTSGLIYEWEKEKKVILDSVLEGVYEKESIRRDILPRAAYDINAGIQGLTASVCNKLFCSAKIEKAIKNMDIQLTLGEDGAIVYVLAARADKIAIINQAWYHYIQRCGSANHTYGLDVFEKLFRLKNYLMAEVKKIGLEHKMKAQVDYYVKCFMRPAIESLFGFDLREIAYLFPYEDVPQNSKIVLYGAGTMGRSYWKCLQSMEYAEVVGWADKNYIEMQKFGLPVEALEDALRRNFDYIVIGINDEKTAEKVKEMLLEGGVKAEKIVWRKRKGFY